MEIFYQIEKLDEELNELPEETWISAYPLVFEEEEEAIEYLEEIMHTPDNHRISEYKHNVVYKTDTKRKKDA